MNDKLVTEHTECGPLLGFNILSHLSFIQFITPGPLCRGSEIAHCCYNQKKAENACRTSGQNVGEGGLPRHTHSCDHTRDVKPHALYVLCIVYSGSYSI